MVLHLIVEDHERVGEVQLELIRHYLEPYEGRIGGCNLKVHRTLAGEYKLHHEDENGYIPSEPVTYSNFEYMLIQTDERHKKKPVTFRGKGLTPPRSSSVPIRSAAVQEPSRHTQRPSSDRIGGASHSHGGPRSTSARTPSSDGQRSESPSSRAWSGAFDQAEEDNTHQLTHRPAGPQNARPRGRRGRRGRADPLTTEQTEHRKPSDVRGPRASSTMRGGSGSDGAPVNTTSDLDQRQHVMRAHSGQDRRTDSRQASRRVAEMPIATAHHEEHYATTHDSSVAAHTFHGIDTGFDPFGGYRHDSTQEDDLFRSIDLPEPSYEEISPEQVVSDFPWHSISANRPRNGHWRFLTEYGNYLPTLHYGPFYRLARWITIHEARASPGWMARAGVEVMVVVLEGCMVVSYHVSYLPNQTNAYARGPRFFILLDSTSLDHGPRFIDPFGAAELRAAMRADGISMPLRRVPLDVSIENYSDWGMTLKPANALVRKVVRSKMLPTIYKPFAEDFAPAQLTDMQKTRLGQGFEERLTERGHSAADIGKIKVLYHALVMSADGQRTGRVGFVVGKGAKELSFAMVLVPGFTLGGEEWRRIFRHLLENQPRTDIRL